MARTRHEEPEFTSYYGRPIINPPIWEELDIGGYLFLGGLAGSSSIIAAAADLTGRRGWHGSHVSVPRRRSPPRCWRSSTTSVGRCASSTCCACSSRARRCRSACGSSSATRRSRSERPRRSSSISCPTPWAGGGRRRGRARRRRRLLHRGADRRYRGPRMARAASASCRSCSSARQPPPARACALAGSPTAETVPVRRLAVAGRLRRARRRAADGALARDGVGDAARPDRPAASCAPPRRSPRSGPLEPRSPPDGRGGQRRRRRRCARRRIAVYAPRDLRSGHDVCRRPQVHGRSPARTAPGPPRGAAV